MRDDFCAFILTHGRPDKVYTYDTLIRAGYTGKVYIVIDDEDRTTKGYRDRFGDQVLQFSKKEIAATIDEGDITDDRRAIIYARNACFDLARKVGCRTFIELDDDYQAIHYRNTDGSYVPVIRRTIDDLIEALLVFYESTPTLSVAVSQGGDHIGGRAKAALRRKAMNTFICSVDRSFKFFGRINEDVNTCTTLGRAGALFFTVMQAQIVQHNTQQNAGGMADLYLDSGTYVKSFYSVMYCPSSVKIGQLVDHAHTVQPRIHHRIDWNATAPRILNEKHRKATVRSKSNG